MIPALLAPLLLKLAESGLGMLAGAIQAKGKEIVEKELGVKIPDDPKDLTPELLFKLKELEIKNQEYLLGLQYHLEETATTQVTERWKLDMSSDSWLSKNIRPMVLLWLIVLLTAMVIADAMGARFQDRVTALVELALSLVLAAYFVGRTAEKITGLVKGVK